MGYDLHIERVNDPDDIEPQPIPLEEWKAALLAVPGVRPAVATSVSLTNPKTGEVISVHVRPGSAEVFWPDEQEWRAAMYWFEGSITFSGRNEPGTPVWLAAVQLARHLNAVIRGDEGERYDLETGDVVHD